MSFRIGHGYDVHRFTSGDYFTLGGVKIPYQQSLLAHSDGDVLIHALMDAMLGAAALGDIGQHFPDSDPQYQGCSSLELLRHVNGLIAGQSFRLMNLDATIVAQAPKMSGYLSAMKNNLSEILLLDHGQMNIKATTTEGLGYIGRGEGIAVHAVVMLESHHYPRRGAAGSTK